MANGSVSGFGLEELKGRLNSVEVDGERYWVVEGDLLLDEAELELHAMRLAEIAAFEQARLGVEGGAGVLPSPPAALVGITQGGDVVRWAPGVVLSYTVLRQTFAGPAEYDAVVENMAIATANWEDTCGVKFDHRNDLDDSATTSPDGVLFPVRGIDSGGRFIASAFFPNGPKFRRRVLIDPSYFATSFDKAGVLRHELGHVLGFRHEHIRSLAPAQCPNEPTVDTIDLTQYDPQSVMHYFCGGVGTRDLRITDVDKEGSRRIYGLPLSMLQMIEP